MDIFKYQDPLVIELEDNNIRLIAELFRLEELNPLRRGIVFADTFWYDADGAHPFHEVEGVLVNPEPLKPHWDIDDAEIYPLNLVVDEETKKRLVAEWDAWKYYRANEEDGKKATRELLRSIIKGLF